ncbi:MAG: bifunctional folylpolyglutamate synthase/dihydrofolate synthase [Nitrospiraceae bacterium]|nr:bifunctional folylpolyglutamate synthase/dihydrofolate synthase [Nitrospiraceae bacterium]
MSYRDSIDYLYSLQKYGIKFGLANITELLYILGDPQKSFASIHIAGTNGKGSTAAMLASIFHAAGFKTGLFTSPHLVSFTERIRINSKEITEKEVVKLTEKIRDAISKTTLTPTFFEFITAMGFLYFKNENIDIAVVEAGMGGRLDATNILIPKVSVITEISYDHKSFLGNTLKEIAAEKAGIIKEEMPVVTLAIDKSVREVIMRKASEQRSELFIYGRDFIFKPLKEDTTESVFDYSGEAAMDKITIPLAGRHQLINAAVALKTCEIFIKKNPAYKKKMTVSAIKKGLREVKWPGRMEMISANPSILIDGAHNSSAAGRLAESLKNLFLKKYKRIILILGIMADKDIKEILAHLLPLASDIILTAPDFDRAASPDKLTEEAESLGFKYTKAKNIKDAVYLAANIWGNGDLIVITGSFYTIGEAKEILGEKAVLSKLRETI